MKVLIGLCAFVALVASVPTQKWHSSSDGCPYYIEHEQKFNWFQAWEECFDKNMTLVAMDTLYKHQQVDGLVQLLFPKKLTAWLAGHDNAVDKRHVWASTNKVFGFSNWAVDQPNFAATDHCVLIHAGTNQWHDFPCSTKLGFICEDMKCSNARAPDVDIRKRKDDGKYNVNVFVNQKLE